MAEIKQISSQLYAKADEFRHQLGIVCPDDLSCEPYSLIQEGMEVFIKRKQRSFWYLFTTSRLRQTAIPAAVLQIANRCFADLDREGTDWTDSEGNWVKIIDWITKDTHAQCAPLESLGERIFFDWVDSAHQHPGLTVGWDIQFFTLPQAVFSGQLRMDIRHHIQEISLMRRNSAGKKIAFNQVRFDDNQAIFFVEQQAGEVFRVNAFPQSSAFLRGEVKPPGRLQFYPLSLKKTLERLNCWAPNESSTLPWQHL